MAVWSILLVKKISLSILEKMSSLLGTWKKGLFLSNYSVLALLSGWSLERLNAVWLQAFFMFTDFSERKLNINIMSAMTDSVKKRTAYVVSQKQESHTSGYVQPKVNLVSSDPNTASGSSFLFQNFIKCFLTCPGFLNFVSAYTQNI